MSVFVRLFNVTLLSGVLLSLTGCPQEEPVADPGCRAGEQRPADDGCNTCVCDADGSWACTERACAPCGPDEVEVDGDCRLGCYGDAACGEGQRCNAGDVCLAPPGGADLAVCYGYCVPEQLDCPAVACDLFCEHGYAQDANGCGICACLPPPMCEPVDCEIFCEFGHQTGPDGCEICACNPAPACDDVLCDLYCEFGHVIDANGCATCECNPPPACEPVACNLYCEFGFQTGADGCEICACNPAPMCEDIACDLDCEFGYQTDDRGCTVCACNPEPACEPVLCEIYCEFGFQTDADGCAICACNPVPLCQPADCDIDCEHVIHEIDENGCEVCRCGEPPVCEPVLCDLDCEQGFRQDANGCDICACAEEPACAEGEVPAMGGCYQGCYGDEDCAAGEICNAPFLCLPPPGADGADEDFAAPAVCYGYCVSAAVDG